MIHFRHIRAFEAADYFLVAVVVFGSVYVLYALVILILHLKK
jgi:hypothetical protein